jgi:sensor histidine kinase YesM
VLKRILPRYALYFLAWTLFSVFMFSQSIMQKIASKEATPWWHYLCSWLVGNYLWALITPGILWLGRRFPLDRNHWMRRTAIHLPLSVVVGILQLAVEAVILRALGVFPTMMVSLAATFVFLMIIGFHQSILMYWMILAAQYGFGWYRRYEERKREALRLELRSSQLEGQLAQAHLSALKMQLHPHFLFNTLNAIMVLVRQEKGREAEEMLGRLSDLLRCVLEDVDAQEIPLRRELEYLQLYLSIEQVRFQDRLRVEIVAAPETLAAAVPHMVLQPIVENAIRHGIGRSLSAGHVRITARCVDGMLEMQVQDDGPGIAAAGPEQVRGIGLANTRERLSQLYGEAGRLTVENQPQGGVAATLVLPYRAIDGASEADFLETHGVHSAAG